MITVSVILALGPRLLQLQSVSRSFSLSNFNNQANNTPSTGTNKTSNGSNENKNSGTSDTPNGAFDFGGREYRELLDLDDDDDIAFY